MSTESETLEIMQPTAESFTAPVRTVRSRIDGRPVVTRFTVTARSPSKFEIHLPDEERVIMVPRAAGQNAMQALRAYLTGGAQ